MKKIFLSFLSLCFIISFGFTQSFNVLTWNIQDLGRTKDDTEVSFIAKILKEHDIIAIQEVVAKDPAGAQAVARIADQLNRMGDKWDYHVSDPTNSPSSRLSERYAFIWRASKIQMVGRPFLDRELQTYCIREPFIGQFKIKGNGTSLHIVNFHSRVHSDNPASEIKYFSQYQKRLQSDYVIIAGDFNLDENDPVWNELYNMGFSSSIKGSPTTLKRKCLNGLYLNHSIDNIYYDQDVLKLVTAGRVDFVGGCDFIDKARTISDHLPVYLECAFLNNSNSN